MSDWAGFWMMIALIICTSNIIDAVNKTPLASYKHMIEGKVT